MTSQQLMSEFGQQNTGNGRKTQTEAHGKFKRLDWNANLPLALDTSAILYCDTAEFPVLLTYSSIKPEPNPTKVQIPEHINDPFLSSLPPKENAHLLLESRPMGIGANESTPTKSTAAPLHEALSQ